MRGRFRFRVGGAGAAGEVPFGVRIVEGCVNATNETNITLRITGVEVGDSVDWSVGAVNGNVVISSVPELITGVNLSSLPDGMLTVSGLNNTTSDTSTSTKTKDTVSPSGYAVVLSNPLGFTEISTQAKLDFTGLEVGAVVNWSVERFIFESVSGSFIASAASESLTVDVSSLSDGNLQAKCTLTDACGNVGSQASSAVVVKDSIAPSGYSIDAITDPINNQNETNIQIDFVGLEIGATAFWSITDGVTTINDDFVVSSISESIFEDVSTLNNGTLTVSLVLVDTAGNQGAIVTATTNKQVFTPSGYSVAFDAASYDGTTGLAASATVTGANVGNTYYFEITSSGGGTPITGSGTVASSSFQIVEDITSLSSGTGTIEYYEVDTFGNVGGDVSDTATFDLTVPLLLDLYPNATCAYSVSKLRNAYTGAAIRVRRDTDNAEQDIGFVNNELDTASLLTFVGAGSGFVTTIYDQSAAGNHYTQTNAVRQGRIVISGVLQTRSGKPIILRSVDNNGSYISSNDFISDTNVYGMHYVGDALGMTQGNLFGSSSGASDYGYFYQISSSTTAVNGNATPFNQLLNGTSFLYANRGQVFTQFSQHFLFSAGIQFNFAATGLSLGYRFANPSNFGMANFQLHVVFDDNNNQVAKDDVINTMFNVF